MGPQSGTCSFTRGPRNFLTSNPLHQRVQSATSSHEMITDSSKISSQSSVASEWDARALAGGLGGTCRDLRPCLRQVEALLLFPGSQHRARDKNLAAFRDLLHQLMGHRGSTFGTISFAVQYGTEQYSTVHHSTVHDVVPIFPPATPSRSVVNCPYSRQESCVLAYHTGPIVPIVRNEGSPSSTSSIFYLRTYSNRKKRTNSLPN